MTDKTDPARLAALNALDAVVVDGALLAEVLPKLTAGQDGPTRARTGRLTLETLRWSDRADRALGPYLRNKPYPEILNALRLGTVSICQLDEAPHGVVNDLIATMKSRPQTKRGAGLANAVLRKIAQDKEKWANLPVPRLPKWLRKQLLTQYGKANVEAMEAAHSRGAPIDVSVMGDKQAWAQRLGGTLLPTGSIRLPKGAEVSKLPGFAEGAWWVQDAAAALPVKVLDPKVGERILDLGAAPGGKTMQLAAAGATVTALDISEARVARIHENLTRTGLKAEVVVADALDYEAAPFDAILLDAPCSATGTIRRHPDLPHAKAETSFDGLITLQAQMIDKALGLLKPGGRLVFCTCSLLESEGEGQIKAALTRHQNITLRKGALTRPGVAADWIGPMGLRTRPDHWSELGGMDGFFLSCLQKNA